MELERVGVDDGEGDDDEEEEGKKSTTRKSATTTTTTSKSPISSSKSPQQSSSTTTTATKSNKSTPKSSPKAAVLSSDQPLSTIFQIKPVSKLPKDCRHVLHVNDLLNPLFYIVDGDIEYTEVLGNHDLGELKLFNGV